MCRPATETHKRIGYAAGAVLFGSLMAARFESPNTFVRAAVAAAAGVVLDVLMNARRFARPMFGTPPSKR
jgi:hypothetical protein